MSELPVGWSWADLSQACNSITDGDHQAPPQVPAGIPFLVIGNIRTHQLDFTDCRHVPSDYFESLNSVRRPQAGDVLYSLVGSYGISVLVKDDTPFCVQRHIGILRPSQRMNSAFLALALSSRAVFDQATEFATGTAQMTVPLSGLRRIRIALPPRPEQDRIVAAIEEQFSRLDAGVAALERARHNIKRMRAAALGGLLHAEDGIPFAEVALGDVLMRGRYGTSTKCSATGEGLPVLRIPNVQSGKIVLSDLKYAIDLSVDIRASRVEKDDILIIRTNGSRSLIGRAAVVPQLPYQVAFASYLIQLKMDSARVNPEYVVAALSAPSLRVRIEELAATSAGQYNISLDKLRSLRIPLPSLSQQARALSTASSLLSFADQIDKDVLSALIKANNLRSAILTRAFAGELVPQDAGDEPAAVLLERMTAVREASNGHKAARTRKARAQEREVTA